MAHVETWPRTTAAASTAPNAKGVGRKGVGLGLRLGVGLGVGLGVACCGLHNHFALVQPGAQTPAALPLPSLPSTSALSSSRQHPFAPSTPPVAGPPGRMHSSSSPASSGGGWTLALNFHRLVSCRRYRQPDGTLVHAHYALSLGTADA